MDNHFVEAGDGESVEELLRRSQEQPLVIFKHSLTCSLSADAYEEMTRFHGRVVLVPVQKARNLSREIENKTGIAHSVAAGYRFVSRRGGLERFALEGQG